MASFFYALFIVTMMVLMFAILRIARLQRENRLLRMAIAEHRDALGNDRCWLDDEALYRNLDGHKGLTVLPSWEVFGENCRRFHANRQHPLHRALFNDVHPGGATPLDSE